MLAPLVFAGPQRESITLAEEPRVGVRGGVSGQKYGQAGFEEEYQSELSDPIAAADVYDRLRTGNSTIASILQRIEGPIRQAAWTVVHGAGAPVLPSVARAMGAVAAGAVLEDEQARAAWLVESMLFGSPFPEYAMRQSWRQQTLHEFCTALAFPFAMFEAVPRWQKGALGEFTVLDSLNWMHPRSVRQVRSGETGEFLGILQEVQHSWNDNTDETLGGVQSRIHRAFIPVHRLVVHARNREGANPGGTSLVRHMYGDTRRQEHAIKWQAIDAQNRAIGIPMITLAKGATPKQLTEATKVARRLTMGNKEQAFIVAEDGTEIGFVQMGANVANMDAIIQAQEARIRSVASAEVFALGQAGSEGSRAVASEFTPYFDLLVKSCADALVEDVQRQIIAPFHALNFGDTIPCPKLHVGNVARPNVEKIVAAIAAGGVQKDGDVEQALRAALDITPLERADVEAKNERSRNAPIPQPSRPPFGAPSAAAPPPAPAEPQDDEKPATFADRARPVRLAEIGPGKPILRALRRDLTEHEAKFACLADIDAAFDNITKDFVQAVRPLRESAVDEALRRMTVDGPKVTIPRLKAKPLRDAILAVITKARGIGRETAHEEIRAQVEAMTTGLKAFDPFDKKPRARVGKVQLSQEIDKSLEAIVGFRVDSILQAVADAVKRSVIASYEEGVEGGEAIDRARRETLERSDAPLESAGREMASRGINNGRAEGAAEAEEALEPAGLVEIARRSAALDNATCPPCVALDHSKSGTDYEIGSDEYFADMPPAHCDGSASCRCVFTFHVIKRAA